MPTVPVYGGPKVQSSAGPSNLGINTTQAPQGGFNGEDATAKLMDAGQRLFQKAQADADQVAVMEADKRLTELEVKLLYDPATGAFNKKGKDAFGSVESVNEEYEKAFADIDSNLTTDRQKKAFQQAYQQRHDQVNRQLNQHVAVEIQKYDAAETEAYLSNQRNLAIANPYDNENIERAKQAQAEKIYQHAQRTGMPAEWAKEKITQAVSATNLGVLNQQVAAGDDIAAEKFFAANKDTFFGDDQIRATRIVEEGSTLGKSMRAADSIFQSTGSLTEAMRQTKGIENPKVRQATEQRLSTLFQQKRMADNEFEENVNKAVVKFVDSGQGTADQFFTKNPQILGRLTTQQMEAARSYGVHRGDKSDGITAYDLERMAANPQTRDQFIQMDLSKLLLDGKINKSELAKYGALQVKGRAGEGQKEFDTLRNTSQLTNEALVSMGINPEVSVKNSDSPKVTAFKDAVELEMREQHEALGRPLKNEEIKAIVRDKARSQVIAKGWIWDTTKFDFEMTEAEKADVMIAEIPKAEIDKIRASLKANNMPVNNANTVYFYKRMQSQPKRAQSVLSPKDKYSGN